MDLQELIAALVDRCYKLILRRPRSEYEIRTYLAKREEDEDVVEEVVTLLKEKKLVDDDAFVRWWVEQRTYFKPRGQMLLKQELRQKGVDAEIIDAVLEDVGSDEYKLAYEALFKYRRALERVPSDERFKKAVAFLARRGFSYSAAKKAFEELYSIE